MSQPMQTVVLAGGRGEGMLPTTQTTPAFLLPVHERPFGAWLLERLAFCGVSEVVLCIGHLGDKIRYFVGNGKRFGLAVRYVDEGSELRGTAGALRYCLDRGVLHDNFLVTYGDCYLPFDYLAPLMQLRRRPSHSGVLAVLKNKNRWGRSNVRLDESGTLVAEFGCEQRPEGSPDYAFIDYGAMALRREVVKAIPADVPQELGPWQRTLAQGGLLGAYPAKTRFFEVRTRQGLVELEGHLRGALSGHWVQRKSLGFPCLARPIWA